jgi:hypothetical protein
MGRIISAGSLARAQADFFFPTGSSNRITNILYSSIQSKLFFNNSILPWQLVDGTSVLDSSISAGKIYFNEISGNLGYYSVRFFPDKIGFWRLILKNISSDPEVVLEFDTTSPQAPSGGLNASFTK